MEEALVQPSLLRHIKSPGQRLSGMACSASVCSLQVLEAAEPWQRQLLPHWSVLKCVKLLIFIVKCTQSLETGLHVFILLVGSSC